MFTLLVRGVLGIVVLVGVAWLLSSDRRHFPWKIVLVGLALQWGLGWVVLRTDPGRVFFDSVGQVVTVVLRGADEGARFVFGPLAGDAPVVAWKAIAGIKIMTTIIIVATLSGLGYHLGILQRVVTAMAWVMRRAMGVSGAESLACAANVFFGQTEAPLVVRPYIVSMTRSEIMALMTGGFATISAGVMAIYVGMLGEAAGHQSATMARHLLTASLMSAPAALMMAKIMVPERGVPVTSGETRVIMKADSENIVDAITRGAADGMKLAINVLAMLIAFIALIAILDAALVALGRLAFMTPVVEWLGMKQLDLNGVLSLLFSPVAWILGVGQQDCRTFGSILGTAMATNEMVAYTSLAELVRGGAMSERSIIMATYSICGFANFSSIGIQIGGIGGLAPERRSDLVRLGPRAMLGGAMASWCTGCIAGVLAQ